MQGQDDNVRQKPPINFFKGSFASVSGLESEIKVQFLFTIGGEGDSKEGGEVRRAGTLELLRIKWPIEHETTKRTLKSLQTKKKKRKKKKLNQS